MRILTWNAHGDLGENSQIKLLELQGIMKEWEAIDPVRIICLQEMNAQSGVLLQWLTSIGWNGVYSPENANGGGMDCAIAIAPGLSFTTEGIVVDLRPFHDPKGPASHESRSPLGVRVNDGTGECYIFTWHATLGARKVEDFENFSKYLEKNFSSEKVILAGDLNVTMEELHESYYKNFMGVSHHLDHILGKGIAISDGIHSEESASDHMPVSAHIG